MILDMILKQHMTLKRRLSSKKLNKLLCPYLLKNIHFVVTHTRFIFLNCTLQRSLMA